MQLFNLKIKHPLFRLLTVIAIALFVCVSLFVPNQSSPFYPQKADAAYAITLDATSTSSGTGVVTWNHTVGNNANRILLVSVNGSGNNAPTVTYAGQTMQKPTNVGGICKVTTGCDLWEFYLLNPPVGTYPIVVTGTSAIVGGAVSYYNVAQTNTFFPSSVPQIDCSSTICNGPLTATKDQLIINIASVQFTNTTSTLNTPVGETLLFSKAVGREIIAGASIQGNGGSTGGNPWTVSPTNTWSDFLTLWAFGLNLAPPSTYTISGTIFNDANKNGIKDASEANYAGTSAITISPNAGTISVNANGTYTISNLPAGTYIVSYGSLPSGYKMTEPLNGPPPSFQVTVGSGCSAGGAKNASCQ